MACILVVLVIGLAMLAVECAFPGRQFERPSGWHRRAICLNVVQAGVTFLSAMTWDRLFPDLALWRLGASSLMADALLGYVAITFVYYWWHRARHEFAFLWRFHQLHHSPCRIEVLTTFYKHPIEILVNGILSSAILYLLLGLDAASASLAILLSGAAELFYHWNIRTPRWLGYMIQRPESHCVHHQRGWHRNNYSDLPLWDILFGTFENPDASRYTCGFGVDAEQHVGTMLMGRLAGRPAIFREQQ